MPSGSNRNNRRSRLRRTSNAQVRLQILKPPIPSVPAANSGSGTPATGKSGGSQRRTRRRPDTPTWLTLFLTLFFGIVLVGAIIFAIVTKEILVIVLTVLVIFATYLFVIKHFYPSEGSSSSSIFTFILEVLKIFKGIPPTH